MNIPKFIAEVYDNAVRHGFWEKHHDISESISLIHCEWSEAIQEYQQGRPMYWRECYAQTQMDHNGIVCAPGVADCPYIAKYLGGNTDPEKCHYRGLKPEGIYVELIDGVIRILSLFGDTKYRPESTTFVEAMNKAKRYNPLLTGKTPLPLLIAACHSLTARAGDTYIGVERSGAKSFLNMSLAPLEVVIGMVMVWIKENGGDPEKIMLEKHEYNKGRPYMHNKVI